MIVAKVVDGSQIALRLRVNPSFCAPSIKTVGDAQDAIFIGNGIGIAGIRVHLKARTAKGTQGGQKGAWLIFGERHRANDFRFADEIAAWQQSYVLDRVLARPERETLFTNLQDRLRAASRNFCVRVDRRAAIYVCGSLEDMTSGVEVTLVEILGWGRLEHACRSRTLPPGRLLTSLLGCAQSVRIVAVR